MVYKSIVHISDPADLLKGIGNIKNFLKDIGAEDLRASEHDIIFIINGPAASVFLEEVKISAMRELSKHGVRFATCRNSLKKMCEGSTCLSEDSLPDFVEVLSAAITSLIELQREGYAYIKP